MSVSRENPYQTPDAAGAHEVPRAPGGIAVAQEAMLERAGPAPGGLIVLLCVIAAIAYMARSCLGVVSKPVEADLGLGTQSLGVAMSAFYWSYALAQVPAGLLGQAWGPRRALVLFASLGAVCCALLATAVDFWTLVLVQVALGFSQAGLFPCAAQAIALWVPAGRRALASGSLGSAMSIGGFIGTILTGYLLGNDWHWRRIYLAYAPWGFLWSILFVLWLRPTTAAAPRSARHGHSAAPTVRVRDLLLHWDMWMICGQQFFRAAGYSFFLTWFPRYLQETRGVSAAQSGYLTSMPLLGVVLGGLLGGFIVDWIDRITASRRASRQGSALFAMFCSAVFILLAKAISDPFGAVLLISCGSFFGGLAGACAYTVTIDKAGHFVAPVFGLMNMTGNIGAAVFPLAVAWFLHVTNENWSALLFLFAGIYVVAGLFWCGLNPEGQFGPAQGPDARPEN